MLLILLYADQIRTEGVYGYIVLLLYIGSGGITWSWL
jgi:hypothetical protein